MSAPSANPGEFGWPWTLRWPSADGASPLVNFAPERLWQPINPGWTFGSLTVNNLNSSAPEVEQAVASRYSYGKQIGRMMDAIEALAGALPAVESDPRIQDFLKLARKVREAKDEARTARSTHLRAELEALKQRDPEEWARLVKP